ncbi:MAG: phosphotransferase, partial [Candidatus Marinimicrobia bacterium]|nr:phosphotransferase [Candidatus Neomarinimicrobiota bacterium]
MKIFIIGVGLSESEIGTQQESFHHHRNIGKREISLLMGSGKLSGFGPLPHILSNISTNHEKQIDHEFIYLENKNHDSIEIVDGLAPIISENINFIESEGDYNWEALGNYLSKEDSESRALIIGTHTELDVLTTAHFLKNNTPLSRVATSPFLVGSATPEGHLSTLRHQLPNAGIEVLLDLEEVADFLNIELSKSKIPINRCLIEPEKIKEELNDAQKYIIETLCMHWSKVELRPLMGGFSGSLLFIANGWKDNAQAEPAVIKIDSFDQMRQEINGYHLVKDLLGKHIPTFAYPVSKDGYTGIAMELASMEGNPKTLQDIFEEATDDVSVNRFNKLLERSLTLLGSKLYGNTKELAWVAPYREFDLHTSLQVKFLEMNFEYIEKYLNDDGEESTGFDIDELGIILGMISKNEDGLNSEISLSHGDLNYANIICDNSDNVWFIDWTHTGYSPLELDFAKLENDTKFVMSK